MIIQLHPDNKDHWSLFERFEKRCVDYGERSGWPIGAEFRQEIRRRFIETPLLAGYFVTEDLDAHVLAWFVAYFGRPGIIIYQCEGRPGRIWPLLDVFFESVLPNWIQRIDALIKRPIEFIEVNVERERDKAWQEMLERYRPIRSRRAMTVFDLEPIRR
jgi:hypothetical protein